jgi:phosphinothricin acetyltransferase
MIIRPASAGDSDALASIYGWHAVNGTGTFEEAAPSPAEMETRRAAVTAHCLPYLVAADRDRILGFAYAAPFRPRSAYRFTVEDSVYVAPEQQGRGVGKALLSEVLRACAELGMRQVVAVIGDSANAASIALHGAVGFTPAGTGRSLGFKHGRWLDVVWMQKALNGGAAEPPPNSGLALG